MVALTKTKTRKGKRILEGRAPKVIENDKTAIIVKGGKTSDVVTSALKDLYQLKKPLATHLKRHNPIHPFEDDTTIVKFAAKFDTSLFLFGSNSKKHPNSLIFGRIFDGQVLDMAELRVIKFIPASKFDVPKPLLGSKPCIVLEGPQFEEGDMKRIGNLMIDWFKGASYDNIRLQGLETVICLTAEGENILFRAYRTRLLKSASLTPYVELEEMGPSIDFQVCRTKLADESLFKSALKKPKQLIEKKKKNLSEDVMGNKLARIHIGKQDLNQLQTRKMKGLKGKNKGTTTDQEE